MSETSIPFGPPSPTAPTASEPRRRLKVRVDASGVKSTFVNTVKASTTPEVVVVEMGFLQVLDGAGLAGGGGGKGGGEAEARLDLEHRAVMTIRTLKRLAIETANLTREYEDRYGTIAMEEDAP